MNKAELIEKIAKDVGISKRKASDALDELYRSLTEDLKGRRAVKIGSIGTVARVSKRRKAGKAVVQLPESMFTVIPKEISKLGKR